MRVARSWNLRAHLFRSLSSLPCCQVLPARYGGLWDKKRETSENIFKSWAIWQKPSMDD